MIPEDWSLSVILPLFKASLWKRFPHSSISGLLSRLLARCLVKSRHEQPSIAFNPRSGRFRKSRVARKAAFTSQRSGLSFFTAAKPGPYALRISAVLRFLTTTASAVSSVVIGVTASHAKLYVIASTSAHYLHGACNAGSDGSGTLLVVLPA